MVRESMVRESERLVFAQVLWSWMALHLESTKEVVGIVLHLLKMSEPFFKDR